MSILYTYYSLLLKSLAYIQPIHMGGGRPTIRTSSLSFWFFTFSRFGRNKWLGSWKIPTYLSRNSAEIWSGQKIICPNFRINAYQTIFRNRSGQKNSIQICLLKWIPDQKSKIDRNMSAKKNGYHTQDTSIHVSKPVKIYQQTLEERWVKIWLFFAV